ncbi:MAG TPA: hypothetical protein VGX03_31090 [Candidatus Binatia bacterium]|jgi:hypothetical protein|nr:hypothetical protein [Candidatus Binatia bacterium]
MTEQEMIATIIGLLGVLILLGFIFLSRDLREISCMTEESLKLSRDIRQRVS